MKRHLNILTAIIMLAGVFTVGAKAQTPSAPKVLATIPFAFNVGDKTLPAGRYTITVLNPASDRKILQLRSTSGRATAMILTTSVTGNPVEDAKLVFHRYGDRYFFAQAQIGGDEMRHRHKPQAERAEHRAATQVDQKDHRRNHRRVKPALPNRRQKLGNSLPLYTRKRHERHSAFRALQSLGIFRFLDRH